MNINDEWLLIFVSPCSQGGLFYGILWKGAMLFIVLFGFILHFLVLLIESFHQTITHSPDSGYDYSLY